MLTEMDGYSQNEGIVVLAATNLPDVIDKALTRPGRFNRKIMVGLPDLKARINILNVHVKDKKLAEDLDLKNVAKLCIGMSGADLANVMNEAAILAVRAEKTEIDFEVV
jgi:cell division protease FtsH